MHSLYLVRHAVAADQEAWPQPDEMRPLTALGWQQALAIAQVLNGAQVQTFKASPTVRCRDTLLPAAHTIGLEVEDAPTLFEQAGPTSPGDALQMMQGMIASYFVDGTTVAAACSHGNVLVPLLEAAATGAGARCPKGGVWKLDLASGEVTSVTFLGRLMPATGKWEAR
ncbi:MAG: SixA phosphatase family protein [Candidatus Dormibacteria bacterium]